MWLGSTMKSDGHLYSIKIKEIWAYLRSQDILFWLINFYLFLEYVRPQSLYPALNVMPYAQITLVVTLLIFFFKTSQGYVHNIQNVFLIIFLGVILLSSAFALSFDASFQKLPEFIAWMVIYFLIINIVNTEKRFFIYMLAFLLYSFKMSQFSFKNWASRGFSFSEWGTGGGPGWFQNSGEFGIQMCIFLPLATYFFIALYQYWPKWKRLVFILFPLTALTGTISSSSRGALVGAGAVILWMLFKGKHKMRGLVATLLTAALIVILLPPEQKMRFEAAGEDGTSIARLHRWEKGMEMVSRYPVLGVGFNNWPVADKALFGGTGELSHNIFIECMSELGYAGLTVFILMILFTFINNHRTRQIASKSTIDNKFIFFMAHGLDAALIGFLVSGFFVTVLYYPYFWINLSMTVALNNIANTLVNEQHVPKVLT